jgi:LPXTG-site transpeptidase (sortase) family protein
LRIKKQLKFVLQPNVLVACGVILVLAGVATGTYNWRKNEIANQHAAKLVYEANHGIKNGVPSTVKLSKAVLADYVVAPSLPRYLIIPALGINTQILSVDINAQGALETPDNVFETAWYDKTAKPGQLGAMLIDGHISSWTSPGVFYGLDTLQSGDAIDVQSGNGAVFSYKVVKTQIYEANNVDMTAAMKPIDPTKPGLNLISCTGDVIAGTSEFNERIIVFAEFDSN